MENIPLTIGNIDKNALEEAVRIKEKVGGKVIVVSAGTEQLTDTIKEALAMGADEAILITSPEFEGIESSVAATTLAKAIARTEDYSIILVGEGSSDNYSGQVGPRIAEILDLPQVTYVNSLEVENDTLKATRNLDDCFEKVEVKLPAVVSVVSEINEPRIPSVTKILRAGRKPQEVLKPEELGLDMGETIQTISNLAPEQDRKRVLFQEGADKDVASLVAALEAEGLVRR